MGYRWVALESVLEAITPYLSPFLKLYSTPHCMKCENLLIFHQRCCEGSVREQAWREQDMPLTLFPSPGCILRAAAEGEDQG